MGTTSGSRMWSCSGIVTSRHKGAGWLKGSNICRLVRAKEQWAGAGRLHPDQYLTVPTAKDSPSYLALFVPIVDSLSSEAITEGGTEMGLKFPLTPHPAGQKGGSAKCRSVSGWGIKGEDKRDPRGVLCSQN